MHGMPTWVAGTWMSCCLTTSWQSSSRSSRLTSRQTRKHLSSCVWQWRRWESGDRCDDRLCNPWVACAIADALSMFCCNQQTRWLLLVSACNQGRQQQRSIWYHTCKDKDDEAPLALTSTSPDSAHIDNMLPVLLLQLKKILSANAEAPLSVECIMEDTDVRVSSNT